MVSAYLSIPPSSSLVTVKILNAADMTVPAGYSFGPVSSPNEKLHCPAYCFLIEHYNGTTGHIDRVVFDLGVRKDVFSTGTPAMRRVLVEASPKFVVEKDIAEQLVAGGVSLETVGSIIWSHAHIDHTGM
jgi:beta-lactamase superfamily II metal-dependent hydrolase